MKTKMVVLILINILWGCSDYINPKYYEFAETYNLYDFYDFKGYSIFRRGYDAEGNVKIHIAKVNVAGHESSGNVIFHVDASSQVVKLDTQYLKVNIELEPLTDIVLKFKNLDANLVSVDNENNIWIMLYSVNSPDLVRTKTGLLPKNKKGKWKQIAPNWHVRIR